MTNIPEELRAMVADLHEDLAPFVREGRQGFGTWVHHPLVVSIYAPGLCGTINKVYEQKREAVAKALENGDLAHYVFLHERPYRSAALRVLEDRGKLDLDTAAAWKLVKRIWIDSENVQQEDAYWRRLWMDKRAHLAMDDDEAVALALLPDPIMVWHGLERRQRHQLGYSWTTSRATGVWFAHRFASLRDRPAWLCSGVIAKRHVRAYLLDRGEHEIIAKPANVQARQITTLRKGEES